MRSSNPWWSTADETSVPFHALRERQYFQLFLPLAISREPNRALMLMGPRRVGKTVLVFHLIRRLVRSTGRPAAIFYLDLQQPLYNGLGLEDLLKYACEASGQEVTSPLSVCFDEIQYFRNWEVHLKTLVDSYPNIKFIATGSAAAALKLKSNESGAGRFTDFLLPPLTFFEYLDLLGRTDLVQVKDDSLNRSTLAALDIEELNNHFVSYLNSGGYPEAVFSGEIRKDLGRYIRSDIVDKVLLKDLPSLYGIQDIQELNALFTTLAYNTANEVSLGELSQTSGVAKNTIKRYIEYLQSAFLIRVVHRVDQCGKRFKRANFFKVYLTNPSIRSALFSPIEPDDGDMGDLVETAVFAQWFHSLYAEVYYARWKSGEVDMIHLGPRRNPAWAVEVKWRDRYERHPSDLASLTTFSRSHPKCKLNVTTRTRQSCKQIDGKTVHFLPASLYCYQLGFNIITGKKSPLDISADNDGVD